jgi:hypothetical protein
MMELGGDECPEHEERRNAQGHFLEHHCRERSARLPRRWAGRRGHRTANEQPDPHDQRVGDDPKERAGEQVDFAHGGGSDPGSHQGKRDADQPPARNEGRNVCLKLGQHGATVATDVEGVPGPNRLQGHRSSSTRRAVGISAVIVLTPARLHGGCFMTRSGHPNGGGGWPRRPWNGRPVATPAFAPRPQPTGDSISTVRRVRLGPSSSTTMPMMASSTRLAGGIPPTVLTPGRGVWNPRIKLSCHHTETDGRSPVRLALCTPRQRRVVA